MTVKRFTLVNDYLIEYDGSYFDLHKPSDIRSLVTVIGYVTEENEQLKQENQELRLLVDALKEQNMKFKLRLKDLGVEYYD